MSDRYQSFSELLLECIDEGLSILGREPCEAVYQFLRTIGSLQREDIPDHIPDFASGLKRALGGASRVIERIILRKLFEKTGSSFREIPDTDFNEYVLDAKRRFEILSYRHEEQIEGSRSKKSQVSG
jgi:hypothetical protein